MKGVGGVKVRKNLPLWVVGSVGFNFSEILRAVALNKGVKISNIIQSPIAALVAFHHNELMS